MSEKVVFRRLIQASRRALQREVIKVWRCRCAVIIPSAVELMIIIWVGQGRLRLHEVILSSSHPVIIHHSFVVAV